MNKFGFFWIVVLVFFLFSRLHSQDSETKESSFAFDNRLKLNYIVVKTEPYIQWVWMPEFQWKNGSVGFHFPLSQTREYRVRTIEYNSIPAHVSRLYSFHYTLPVFSISVEEIRDISLGSGFLVHHYSNDLFYPEIRNLGLQFSLQLKGFRWKGIMGNFFTQELLASRMTVPLRDFFDDPSAFLGRVEVGFSFASDLAPSKREYIQVQSLYEHKIQIKENGNLAPHIFWGVDLTFRILEFSKGSWSLQLEWVRKDLNDGDALSYGFVGNLGKLEYHLAFRHFLDSSFAHSHFDRFYSAVRSEKLSPKSEKMGFGIELSMSLLEDRLTWTLGYEQLLNPNRDLHLFIELVLSGLPKGLFLIFVWDRIAPTTAEFFVFESTQTYFLSEFSYRLNDYIEFGFRYRKSLFPELEKNLDNLTAISILTQFFF